MSPACPPLTPQPMTALMPDQPISAPHSRSILVIEDDRTLNRLICNQLEDLGHRARGARSQAEALEALELAAPDLAFLDMRLPDADGITFLPRLAQSCPVIILTAYGSIDQAVEAVRGGAVDYLVKPVTPEALELAIGRVFETVSLRSELAFWQAEAQRIARFELVADSPAMQELMRLIGLVAGSDAPVLIRGEGGTGKSVVAHAIHQQSPRANGRFITIDCDDDLSAEDLFGTAALDGQPGRAGLLAPAESGTVFLNDVDRLPAPLHGPVLRLIEQGMYRPHRSSVARPCRARFIAASSADLETLVQEGDFRADLYYQLAGMALPVPPLRERREDIPALAHAILAARSFQRAMPKDFTPEALAALAGYDWPGNIRQLHNAVERAVIMSGDQPKIGAAHFGLTPEAGGLPAAPGDAFLSLRFDHLPTLEDLRAAYLEELIIRCDGNRQRIAQALGVSERNTYRLLKKRPAASD